MTPTDHAPVTVERLKPQYPDYLDDPDGLARFRQDVQRTRGHDMAKVNHNSLGRLLDTIERLRSERDCLAALASAPAEREAFTAKRRRLGWSLRDVEREIGIAFSTLSRFERGERVGARVAAGITAWIGDPDPAQPSAPAFRPMSTWDCRDEAVLLLVDYSDGGAHPIDDAALAITIGHNNDHNVGEGEGQGWLFAGWCNTHEHYVQGEGKPVGWLPLPQQPASAPAGDGPARIDRGASEALGEMVWTTAPAGDDLGEPLWCLHVLGPDDVHPAPDRATAQLWAAQWTVWWHRKHPVPHLHDPVMSWVVAPWPHDPASHVAGLAKSVADNTWPVDPLAALARPRAAVGERTVADSHSDFIAAIVAGAPKGEPTIVEYAPDGLGWSVYDRAKHPVEFFGLALVDRVELAARVLWADGQTRLGQSVSDLPRTRTDFRNRARKLLAEHPALALQSPLAKVKRRREQIAQIVARAYGGSLYPGLGVPGDYPTADVDYRAADAICALHDGVSA